MSKLAYQDEPWFELLAQRCQDTPRAKVAALVGVSAPVISQVLNGTGKYGSGEASTKKLADRVLHTFGRYPCPHLTVEEGGTEVIVTAGECRVYAHRPPPIGSPRDLQHWQACQGCPHKAASAPPVLRIPKPRKGAADFQSQGANDADAKT